MYSQTSIIRIDRDRRNSFELSVVRMIEYRYNMVIELPSNSFLDDDSATFSGGVSVR